MSLLGRLLPHFVNSMQRNVFAASRLCFHSLTQEAAANATPGGSFTLSVRNNVRCHFPRPSERKRVKRHGYWHRMSTPGGRRILMRKILKGKHVYSH